MNCFLASTATQWAADVHHERLSARGRAETNLVLSLSYSKCPKVRNESTGLRTRQLQAHVLQLRLCCSIHRAARPSLEQSASGQLLGSHRTALDGNEEARVLSPFDLLWLEDFVVSAIQLLFKD